MNLSLYHDLYNDLNTEDLVYIKEALLYMGIKKLTNAPYNDLGIFSNLVNTQNIENLYIKDDDSIAVPLTRERYIMLDQDNNTSYFHFFKNNLSILVYENIAVIEQLEEKITDENEFLSSYYSKSYKRKPVIDKSFMYDYRNGKLGFDTSDDDFTKVFDTLDYKTYFKNIIQGDYKSVKEFNSILSLVKDVQINTYFPLDETCLLFKNIHESIKKESQLELNKKSP